MLLSLCKTLIGGFSNSKMLRNSSLLFFSFITVGLLVSVPNHALAAQFGQGDSSVYIPTNGGGDMVTGTSYSPTVNGTVQGFEAYIGTVTGHTAPDGVELAIVDQTNGHSCDTTEGSPPNFTWSILTTVPGPSPSLYQWTGTGQLGTWLGTSGGCDGFPLDTTHTYTVQFFPVITSGPSAATASSQGMSSSASDFYFQITDSGFTPPVPDCTDGGLFSCVETVTPTSGSTQATSTSFAFGATGYVATGDAVAGTQLNISATNNEENALGVGVIPLTAYSSSTPLSAGNFTFSDTHDIQRTGDYTLQTSITKPWFSLFGLVNIGSQTIYATTTSFIVSTSSVLDLLGNQVTFATSQASFYDSASTTDTCAFTSASLSNNWFASCGRYLFYPQTICQFDSSGVVVPGSCQTFGQQAYSTSQTFLLKQPWGYATLLYNDIASTTGTSTLPALSFTFPSGQGLPPSVAGQTFNITPWNEIAGPGSFLAGATVPESGNHILTEFLGYWNLLWELMFALYIINEFYGAWRAGDFDWIGPVGANSRKAGYMAQVGDYQNRINKARMGNFIRREAYRQDHL